MKLDWLLSSSERVAIGVFETSGKIETVAPVSSAFVLSRIRTVSEPVWTSGGLAVYSSTIVPRSSAWPARTVTCVEYARWSKRWMRTTYVPGGRSSIENEPGSGAAAVVDRKPRSSRNTLIPAPTTAPPRELVTIPVIRAVVRTSSKSTPPTAPLRATWRVWGMNPSAATVTV